MKESNEILELMVDADTLRNQLMNPQAGNISRAETELLKRQILGINTRITELREKENVVTDETILSDLKLQRERQLGGHDEKTATEAYGPSWYKNRVGSIDHAIQRLEKKMGLVRA